MLRSSSWLGLLLVVGGTFYLLSEFHVIYFPAGIWSWSTLWPLVFVVYGLGGLRGFRRGIPLGALFSLVFGAFLFLRNSELVPQLQSVSGSGVFWALVFIYIGFSVFAPKRIRGPKIVVDFNSKHTSEGRSANEGHSESNHSVGDLSSSVRTNEDVYSDEDVHSDRKLKVRVLSFREAFGDWSTWIPRNHATRHWVGDVSMGSQPWVLEDMSVFNGVGDVRVNLATAHLEDKTYHMMVEGWVGDVRVLVPSSLPVTIDADVNIGDLNVFEHAMSGTGRRVHHVDPLYETALKRVHIAIHLKIGDVQVVRV